MPFFTNYNLTTRTMSSSFSNFVQTTGSLLVNGLGESFFDLSQSISASYSLTSSYALNALPSVSASYAITASYVPNLYPVTTVLSASWASSSISSSYSFTASYALNVPPTISASYSLTSSYSFVSNIANNVSQSNLVGTASIYSQAFIMTGSYNPTVTGSYILTNTNNGQFVVVNSSTFALITVPATLNQGFACSLFQSGSGQIQVIGSGTTIVNRAGLSSSFGQYSIISLLQVSPSNYVLQGDVG
jgi:hypothetical protein